MPSDSIIGKQEARNNNYMSQSNRVAVVVPVRNRPDILEECLSSLANQDFPLNECEVLICDDCSTQDLEPVVNKFRNSIPNIKLLRQEKPKGPAAARNMGFRSSRASIFVCIDSDIICDKKFLTQIVRALAKHAGWIAAQGTVLSKGNIGGILFDAPENRGQTYPSGASAYRADALFKVEGFDEAFLLPACEDVDLAARLLKLGDYGYVAEAVAYHPSRRVTLRTHWRWRRHWKYEMILAKRYGFLSFPGNPAGPFPRLRVALAAIVTLPAGRFIESLKYVKGKPIGGMLACFYAIFDVFCGLWALPSILVSSIPPRRNYLSNRDQDTIQ
jgi:GT2 family glycosyltransferase